MTGMSQGLTVGSVIANAARAVPGATAAVIEGVEYSFEDLDLAGSRVARALVEWGAVPGDVALVFSRTSFELLAHFVGCARAGVVFAPLNPELDEPTIRAVADRTNPAFVLAQEDFASLGELVGAPSAWFPGGAHDRSGHTAPARAGAELPEVHGTDPHVAFFTSGSTGVPKAALVSHRTSVLRSHPGSQLEPRGPALCPWPLFHMAGWTIALGQWHARAPIVFVEGTTAPLLTAALRDHGIERFNAIPALWMRIAEHVRSEGASGGAAFPALRFADTGTSPTSVELLATIADLAPNAHVRVFYGSSEAGNVASLHHEDLLTRPGSCGQPSVLTEVRIASDGELLVRGPLLFDGYLGDEEATDAALVDGWYHTGDRAEMDSDGYLSIVGRVGTVIRTGGESVDPGAVEAALREHPLVEQVAVFGLPDEQWGERVCAAVVATGPLSLADLRSYLDEGAPNRLASHQHPRQLLVLGAIPRTAATGQVDRRRLRQLAEEHG